MKLGTPQTLLRVWLSVQRACSVVARIYRTWMLPKDAIGKPVSILGCTMRGVPSFRAQHRWAFVRVLKLELVQLATKRRKHTLIAGLALSALCYGSLMLLSGRSLRTLELVLAVGGLMGVATSLLSRIVDAPAPVRRMTILSNGVCASCMGSLSRSASSGLATCDSCGACWDGREVHEDTGPVSTMCESCGYDSSVVSPTCPECGHTARAAMGVRMSA